MSLPIALDQYTGDPVLQVRRTQPALIGSISKKHWPPAARIPVHPFIQP